MQAGTLTCGHMNSKILGCITALFWEDQSPVLTAEGSAATALGYRPAYA